MLLLALLSSAAAEPPPRRALAAVRIVQSVRIGEPEWQRTDRGRRREFSVVDADGRPVRLRIIDHE